MSTIWDYDALYEAVRKVYPWLPKGVFTETQGNVANFMGLDDQGRATFIVPTSSDANPEVMWHESGHAAHTVAATLRDAAEHRGTAGNDILNEVAQILCGTTWSAGGMPTTPISPNEYLAEAFRKAHTGGTAQHFYPDPFGQRVPFPAEALKAYFKTMNAPRGINVAIVPPEVSPSNKPMSPSAPITTVTPDVPIPPPFSSPRPFSAGVTAAWRYCFDSTNAADIPAGAQIVAGYIDGAYQWSDADWALHPDAVKVRIACFSDTNDGHVGDVEKGDMTPEGGVAWVQMRRAAGIDPTIYCGLGQWATVVAAFQRANVKEPHYWIAHYDNDATPLEGAVAKQYANPTWTGKHYDISVVAGRWPGVEEEDLDRDTFNQWFREEYANIGAAKKFDDLNAALSGEIAKKANINHPHTGSIAIDR